MKPSIFAALQSYLMRLGQSEYRAGMSAHVRDGRLPKTYRHNPSQYHRDLVAALGDGDEIRFKAIKASQGYSSPLAS